MNKNLFKTQHQLFFAQRFSLLLDSGISMVEALQMMQNIENHKSRKEIYRNLIKDVENGFSVYKSLITRRISFHHLLIVFIQNGESGGYLSEALKQAHFYLEKKDETKKKIVSALVYPSFIVIATIAMTLFLILYIFPKIIPLLSSLDIKLPLMTRIVQWLYYFSISYGGWTFGGVILLYGISVFIVKKNDSIRRRVDFWFITIPIFKKYIQSYLLSSICNAGEVLLNTGKGLPSMLIFSKDSSRNLIYKDVFSEIHDQSMKGISLSTSLNKFRPYFPTVLIDMVSIGERTGHLASMFGQCAKIFEQDIDTVLKRFSSLIEPVLMVLMGLIVGSIALSIILPVYEITNHLSK